MPTNPNHSVSVGPEPHPRMEPCPSSCVYLYSEALAKRGDNVTRCFIGCGPGGVGQSLYSSHLNAVYKHNHSFFDPNIWFNEEEMRKQIEQFAGCFILTGQEAPDSKRGFKELAGLML